MTGAQLKTFATAEEIGSRIADRLLSEIDRARIAGKRYIIGCPTGRTPKPIYGAIADRLSEEPREARTNHPQRRSARLAAPFARRAFQILSAPPPAIFL